MMVPVALTVTVAGTSAAAPAARRLKEAVVTVAGLRALLKVALTVVFRGIPIEFGVGVCKVTVGRVAMVNVKMAGALTFVARSVAITLKVYTPSGCAAYVIGEVQGVKASTPVEGHHGWYRVNRERERGRKAGVQAGVEGHHRKGKGAIELRRERKRRRAGHERGHGRERQRAPEGSARVRSEREGRRLDVCRGRRMTGNGHRRNSEDDDLILRPEGRCSGHVTRLGRQLQQAGGAIPVGRAKREEGKNLIPNGGGHRRRTRFGAGNDARLPAGAREGTQRQRAQLAGTIATLRSNVAVEVPRHAFEKIREGLRG